MLTNNFKNAMAMVLQRCNTDQGMLPIVAYNGTTYYLSPSSAIPVSLTQTLALSESAAGICLGTGNTAAAVTDYQLEAPITAGLQASIVQAVDTDGSGNPYLQFDLTITNNSGGAVTIKEIGYRQNLRGATALGGTGSSRVCLLDRTVLDSPVTIPAGELGVIRYTLKTVIV